MKEDTEVGDLVLKRQKKLCLKEVTKHHVL